MYTQTETSVSGRGQSQISVSVLQEARREPGSPKRAPSSVAKVRSAGSAEQTFSKIRREVISAKAPPGILRASTPRAEQT
ncbi:hypothetical protein SKAU_G00204250 [Synaphobranchus kaupii]|uniref:Uncharacterized protein n=1 Tax=Synaphobranchus kaupii TaxID=118154 RepID=A0A9Q1FG12_SYNKA|nr:hypothetical protein SKAU_G00204250 [Synaphobranchus kaupii]